MRYRALVTDYVWPTLEREQAVLKPVGVELVPAPSGDEETLARLAADVDGIMTCFASVTPAVVRASAQLKVIARYGIGVDNIAVDVATGRDVVVTNVPDYCVEEVAEHALALLFACARRLALYDRAVRDEHWNSKVGMPLFRISGKTLGIVGFGQIGRRVAAKAQALGLRVLAYSPHLTPKEAQQAGCRAVSLTELLEESDFVSLHLPLTPQSAQMFDRERFSQMKPGAIFINTSRGGLVESAALAEALESGHLAAAGVDVLPQEPPDPDEPLLRQDNLVVTPHIAFYSEESLAELQTRTAHSVARVLQGRMPESVVNPEVLERIHLQED
ncbi:MAG: C-terminal binding protein [Chloroflexi bacterium]|nr:C-terminal binding protein [Chloroflexota bacterium]